MIGKQPLQGLQTLDFEPSAPVIDNSVVFQYLAVTQNRAFIFLIHQKLATTCLAAALRYQLGGNEHGVPMYAPVVLDEAFDKADNEFTALAMNIFANFGFQMIVATPLKSVMTLEAFIGGACFIDISDRRDSGVLMIEYDTQQQRLKLPAHAHREASLEVS